jgi:hypothetical protein
MKIYNLDPETNEYIGSDTAQRDPLEPHKWLIPAYAVTVSPPLTSENQVAVWDGTGWQITPDFRGMNYWLGRDKKETMKPLGALPEGATLEEPPMTPEEITEQRRSEILSRLSAIDSDSARPLRAIATGSSTEYDTEKLATLDAEAATLRAELSTLVQAGTQ